ncbi:MAG: hypothetical protein Q7W45_12340 [Bacteroidota bacterium]|nr:hypothetical protein [Bacteroidota bacterium]MDP3146883.1 hypothetical protein [Bacteroidota bacterium]
MENNLQINITQHLRDDLYIDLKITLYSKSTLSPWNSETQYVWEGKYKEQKILVKLNRNDPAEFAKIDKPYDLSITDQIISEIKSVLKRYD